MYLAEQTIGITPKEMSDKQFVIERIHVPQNLVGITILIEVAPGPINFILVYDSLYNLRAEYQDVKNKQRIVIHQETVKSGIETKAGDILAGEWIIALEIPTHNKTDVWTCHYRVMGELKSIKEM